MPATFVKPAPSPSATSVALAGMQAMTYPQPVYAMGLLQVIGGPPPGDNLFVGWRYLVDIGANFGMAVDVDQTLSSSPVYAGISFGREVAKYVQAAQNIETVAGIPA